MTKICVITVQMGPIPSMLEVWLLSATLNPTIDFYVISDNIGMLEKYGNISKNVKFILLGMDEIRKRIKGIVGFDPSLKTAYKLCDYKPFYGLIFSDIIKDYDFWGFSDTDLLFGNLRAFFKESILKSYDRFFDLGHFSLYRNTEQNNRFFMKKVPGIDHNTFLDAASSDRNIYFDEYNGIDVIWSHYSPKRQYIDKSLTFDIDIFHYQMFKNIRCVISDWPFRFHLDDTSLLAIDGHDAPLPIVYAHFQKRIISCPTIDFSVHSLDLFGCSCYQGVSEEEVTRLFERDKKRLLRRMSYYLKSKTLFLKRRLVEKIKTYEDQRKNN